MTKSSIITGLGRVSISRRQFITSSALGAGALLLPSLPSFAADKPKVGLVMKSLANEFFKQMQAGAEDYAAKNTDKFSFAAVGMKDERDFAAQVDAVENFITQQFNVIVLAPADSKAMVTPVKRLWRPASKSSILTWRSMKRRKSRRVLTLPFRSGQSRGRKACRHGACQGARQGRQGGYP